MNPAILGLVAALSWGTHDFAARFAARGIGHVHAVLGVTLAGIFWLGAWIALNDTPLRLHGTQIWLPAVAGASFALATMWLFAGLAIGPIAVVAPIVGAYPVYAVAFAIATGARPEALTLSAMVVVVAGVAIVARYDLSVGGAGVRPGRRDTSALGYAFAAGLAFAVSFTVGQRATPIYGEAAAVFIARFFGLAAIAAVLLLQRSGPVLPLRWWPGLIGMGALDALALVAVVAAGKAPQSEIATVVSSTFGAVTVLLARVFLKEPVAVLQWIGIGLILAGVAALSTKAG